VATAHPGPTSVFDGVLHSRFGEAVIETNTFRGQSEAVVDTSSLLDVIRFLRDEEQMNHLSDVTAVDWLGRDPRFDVVYHLYSFDRHIWYRIKVRIDEGDEVPSVVPLFPCANWAEREVYDLFGIIFAGHPGLDRILLPEGWVGYPLRKDYPLSQITLPRSAATKIPE
jgi:NADH-quinone oxidoreductase subunit C